MTVNKGVILCGGLGTRFLPATKSLPKEMLPVVDTPVLQYIAEEMAASGVTRICIVVSPGKEDIIRHFTENKLLADRLASGGKQRELEILKSIARGVDFTFVTQTEPKGMAHALLQAKDFVGGDPFVLSTGDDLVYASVPVSKQLISAFNVGVSAVIGGQSVADDKVCLYGIADTYGDAVDLGGKAFMCRSIVEKPRLADAPSNFAALGRYVLSAEIFEKISEISPDKRGELQVTDALKLLCGEGKACFYNFEGTRYDMGSKSGAVIAAIEYALRNPETKAEVEAYLKGLAK